MTLTIEQIKKKLSAIKKLGYVKTLRNGPTRMLFVTTFRRVLISGTSACLHAVQTISSFVSLTNVSRVVVGDSLLSQVAC